MTVHKMPMPIPIVSIPMVLKQGAQIPAYAKKGDAGLDLHALLETPMALEPGQRMLVPTGVSVAIPPGYEGQIRPRSGLALNKGITVLNSPGTIDSGYRGEIKVILINLGHEPVTIAHGDRIAQMVIAPVCTVTWVKEDDINSLTPSSRGQGGFGSSGT
jgi:dUTP pyrophosphatase